jgi:hypothetical protein
MVKYTEKSSLSIEEFFSRSRRKRGSYKPFFTIFQDIETRIVLFERELFIPSDEEKGIFFVALFNFGKR